MSGRHFDHVAIAAWLQQHQKQQHATATTATATATITTPTTQCQKCIED